MKAEILLEGSYSYFQGEINYTQETFKLVHLKEQQHYNIYAEILTRTDSGEFLKVVVRYEMTSNFIPFFVRIEKSIGNNFAEEVFSYEGKSNDLKYLFQNSQGQQEFTRKQNNRHHISTPSFATASAFTLSKKFDAAGRTPITIVTSHNDWTYSSPPEEKILYADFKTRDQTEFKIKNASLPASELVLYESDSSSSNSGTPVVILVSKHWGIPYELKHHDFKIIIKNLTKSG